MKQLRVRVSWAMNQHLRVEWRKWIWKTKQHPKDGTTLRQIPVADAKLPRRSL